MGWEGGCGVALGRLTGAEWESGGRVGTGAWFVGWGCKFVNLDKCFTGIDDSGVGLILCVFENLKI